MPGLTHVYDAVFHDRDGMPVGGTHVFDAGLHCLELDGKPYTAETLDEVLRQIEAATGLTLVEWDGQPYPPGDHRLD